MTAEGETSALETELGKLVADHRVLDDEIDAAQRRFAGAELPWVSSKKRERLILSDQIARLKRA